MLSLAIVGLPNVGKSTLFNALTKQQVLAANYPFATIEPNTGIVPLPDPRLVELAKLYHNAPIIPAPVTFVDVAGLVRGASTGQGLGNKFLAHIRESQAIVQVVRVFDDPNVVHVDGTPKPLRDIETINAELILADLATIDRRIEHLASELKHNPKLGSFHDLLADTRQRLDNGQLAGAFLSADERSRLAELQLLTTKPFIIVFNLDETQLTDAALKQQLTALVSPAPSIFLCAKVEAELVDLPETEAHELLASLGQADSGLAQLTSAGFTALGLQTFLTAGPKEVRAWTISQGSTAPQAAGVIHTDFQKGFIKAEIISFNDLISAGSVPAARAAGKARLEGKDYIMRNGDVVEFRFNN